MKDKILLGDGLKMLNTIESETVDCCITSPPYWKLRDYDVDGQLGQEEDFKDFIHNLIQIFNEVKRVLKPTGTCFVNLGDTYNGNKTGNTETVKNKKLTNSKINKKANTSIGKKSLLMIPERFAIQMIDKGWILRNQIIWHKPNQMPSSAKDRFTVDFEKVFFFTKQSKGYYFKRQLEPVSESSKKRAKYGWNGNTMKNGKGSAGMDKIDKMGKRFVNADGRNKRTVWSINTQPNKENHFAMYPERLVETMIKSGCPENGLVLDPFFGGGTTGVVAKKLNRNYLGIEINKEYAKIAKKRLFNEIGLFL